MIYIKHLLFLISTVTGCVSISAFASLVGIPIEFTSYSIKSQFLKLCLISHGEFVLINNMLKEFYDMKGEIINSNVKQNNLWFI